MKCLLVLSVFVAFAKAAPSSAEEFLYTVDFDAIFNNDADRVASFDCILEKTPCGDKQALKDSVHQILVTECANCNPDQKEKYDHVLKQLHDQYESTHHELIKLIASKKG